MVTTTAPELCFTVRGKPAPQGSMRAFNNHVVHTKPKRLKLWRGQIADAAKIQAARYLQEGDALPAFPTGPITVEIVFWMNPPASRSDWDPYKEHGGFFDVDKMLRAACDALSGVAYSDDAQVGATFAFKMVNGQLGQPVREEGADVRVAQEHPIDLLHSWHEFRSATTGP